MYDIKKQIKELYNLVIEQRYSIFLENIYAKEDGLKMRGPTSSPLTEMFYSF
jgi:hypothetical protein